MTQADVAHVFIPLMSLVTNPRFALWCGRGLSGTVVGFMLLDIDFARGQEAVFFRATMRDGVIEVPRLDHAGVRR